jgi:flagella basal body P-ring formation protein FlgA
VCTATNPKRKGETLAREDLSTDTQWMPLSSAAATAEQLAGAVLRNRLNPGQAISADDVAPPVVVSKGDQVTVHCISGSVVVTTRARAVTSGHDGEVIEFEALDSKRRFTARMNGKGQAVVAAPQSTETGR